MNIEPPIPRGWFKEKRRHRRFRLKTPIFAVFEAEPIRLLDVADISMEGLSVCLVAERGDLYQKARLLSIVLGIRNSELDEYLKCLSFRVAFAREIVEQKPGGIRKIRRGLELLELTAGNQEKLARLIMNKRLPNPSRVFFLPSRNPMS